MCLKIFISFQMSKMVIYFSLFIPLLFLSTDSSSIRDRSNKNELVPFLSSKVDPLKRDSNSLKIVSNEPFIIQLQMPNPRERESKRGLEKDKKRKRPLKKRVSKIKPLKKKHRARRELLTPKTRNQEQKSNQSEMPFAVNGTEQQRTNLTKNSINRMEILKALSSYSKKIETKRNKLDESKNYEKVKHNAPSRNHHNPNFSLSDRTPHVKMIYPSTPKPDQHQHKYTYKDLMVDRERLEQKIKYIKNLLNVNDSATEDPIRVRRRTDSDRTANKIAKMFLTLSAVNGLHDRRKSKCRESDEEEDRMRDPWEKETRNNPIRKSASSNEERYKVKKWIEYMKNKRSSGKTCPCMTNESGGESDIFPLEQKLPKGYFLRGKSSEESSESFGDPFNYSRDKLNNNNLKNRFEKYQDQENKLKSLAKNGKKKLELPFDDLEAYRTRAKQILQNAEEILDRIKEEEEKRLQSPSNLMNQLKELTSRIHADPRNNENDLIRKIQKNLGWDALAKPNKETGDNTFIDNVKSFILDPYEKAKALTDESTQKLSSYLLRNLGKLQESSDEQEEGNQENVRENPQVYFEQIPQSEEEKPVSASLAKEDSITNDNPKGAVKNYDDTLFINLNGDDEGNIKDDQEEIFKQRMEDIIKEQQKKLNEFKANQDSEENNQEIDPFDQEEEKVAKTKMEIGESESEINPGNEEVVIKLKDEEENENDEDKTERLMNSDSTKKTEIEEETKSTEGEAIIPEKISENSDFVEKKKNSETDEIPQKKKDETDVTVEENVPAQEEFEKEVKETMKKNYENDKLDLVGDEQKIINTDEQEKKKNAKNEEMVSQESEEQNLGQKKENEEGQNHKDESQKAETPINAQETNLEENTENLKSANQKEREENVLSSPHNLFHDYDNDDLSKTLFETNENLKDTTKAASEGTSDETKSNKETILRMHEKEETNTNEEDSAKTILGENNFIQNTPTEPSEPSQYDKDNIDLKESVQSQKELIEDNEKQQDPANAETTETGAKYDDLVKESVPEQELLESNHSKNTKNSLENDEESKEQEEATEDQNLRMKNPDGEINQASENERKKEAGDDGTQKKVSEKIEKLEKTFDENGSKSASFERDNQENLNENDADVPLRMTLEKNSNEDLGENKKGVQNSQESSVRTNEDDNRLEATKIQNQENDTTEKSINDEVSLKKSLENGNQYEDENDDTTLQVIKPDEEKSNESLDKSKNEDFNTETPLEKKNINNEETENRETLGTTMNKESDEKDFDAEDVDETTLRETISKEDNDKEVNEKLKKSNEEDSSEGFLKSRLKEDDALEGSEETNSNQNINESNDGETDDTLKEISDTIFQKDEEGGKQSSLKSETLTDNFKSQEENEKDYSNETTLRMAANEKDPKNLNETGDNTISGVESKDKEADRLNENDEKEDTLSLGKPENWDENQNQESLLNSKKQDKLKKEQIKEIVSEKVSPDNNDQENPSGKSKDKESLENSEVIDFVNQESDQDQKSKEEGSNETLKEVSVKETQENLDESPNDETLEAANHNEELKQNQENGKDEEILKSTLNDIDEKNTKGTDDDETAPEEKPKQKQENSSKEAPEEKVLDSRERLTKTNEEIERKLDENDSSQNKENLEEMEDSLDTSLRMAIPDEDENKSELNRDNRNSSENDREEIALESAVENQTGEKKEINSDETLREENPEEDQEKGMLNNKDDGISLKFADSENELDNTEENDETLLKSAKAEENKEGLEFKKTISKDESEETLREKNIPDDWNNKIDQESEDEDLLSPKHFDEINDEKDSGKSSHENSYETWTAGQPSIENLSAEDDHKPRLKATLNNDDNLLDPQEEQSGSSLPDFIQKTDSTKTNNLKVPKSIGKIMKALEGKEKDDITSLRNLNPDKIDHIIDKIDEAEQQNLRESLEVDCRKECACAEDIDTKSRNMGRYEIVKDFLFWMKDLQLNRVLSDD